MFCSTSTIQAIRQHHSQIITTVFGLAVKDDEATVSSFSNFVGDSEGDCFLFCTFGFGDFLEEDGDLLFFGDGEGDLLLLCDLLDDDTDRVLRDDGVLLGDLVLLGDRERDL